MAKKGRSDHLQIDGRDVPVTNLDKVLYPENGFTKAQVIDYYIRVSQYLLPHFENRPVTLNRFPDGVRGEAFYEKKAPKFAPAWVKTFPVPDLLTCAEVAFLLKDLLAHLGLEAFAKVSGSKGLQVYVPLNSPVTYAATQPFARAVADLLTKQHPKLILAEMAKSQRANKVFVDWSQNSDFKTTVGVYSLRAKRDRPFVSLPVHWNELAAALKASKAGKLYFEPEAALERLSKVGDLFSPLLQLKQSLPKSITAPKAKPKKPGTALDTLPRSAMKFIAPMQCELVARLPEGEDWRYELKLDGYRAETIKDAGTVTLLSRNNNSLNTKFASVAEGLQTLEDGIILDGEVVALDEQGRPSFGRLQHLSKNQLLVYYAYRGRDITGLPLTERRELLNEVLKSATDPVRVSAVLNASAKDLIEAVRAHSLEGIIAKRTGSKYEPGERSGRWVKYKVNQGQELVIGGYKPSGKNHFDNLAIGYYEGDRLIFIAKLKNGFTPSTKDEIFARFQPYETNECPFDNLPEPKNARRGEALTAQALAPPGARRPRRVHRLDLSQSPAPL